MSVAITWRKALIQSGLLLEQPSPDSSRQPACNCGVSLSWFVDFVDSIKDYFNKGSRSESTSAVMRSFVFPCRFGRWVKTGLKRVYAMMAEFKLQF